jgi:uncharacterized protein (TIGR02996 family)
MLEAALARWRGHRTIAFAQLVTAYGRHVPDADLDAPEPDDDAAIGRLLARPDDPRIALRLARAVIARVDDGQSAPIFVSILDRLAELRDPRALAMVTSVWARLVKPLQNRVALVGSDAPDASDDQALAELRAFEDPDGHVEALWRAVAEDPTDLDRRLVLADALIERGDPRGHAISLQCHDVVEGTQLLEERRFELLGETALLISQAQFRGGLLWSISVGTVTTPLTYWRGRPDDRELCALHDLSPGYTTAEAYAKFLSKLAWMPRWVRLERAHREELEKLGVRCPFRNVEFSLWPPPRDLTGELLAIAAHAPTLEGLAFRTSHWPPLSEIIEVAREVRERVPTLQHLYVSLLPGHGNPEHEVEAARELPFLELVAPLSPRFAEWP